MNRRKIFRIFYDILSFWAIILLVLEIQRFKSVKACRPKARQAKVNANSSTNSLILAGSIRT
ncbi:MAG: hypothetical protein LBP59_17565 [Planctomycetaceae bacterium]|nr:hypothetical protein [Planctomycetaceae bacterium]